MEITKKDIGNTIIALAKSFDDELMEKTESQLEDYWYFEWRNSDSLEWNLYQFYDKLKLYGNFCRRWEESKNGLCCVVERVRDKYLMPKIRKIAKQITNHLSSTRKASGSRE